MTNCQAASGCGWGVSVWGGVCLGVCVGGCVCEFAVNQGHISVHKTTNRDAPGTVLNRSRRSKLHKNAFKFEFMVPNGMLWGGGGFHGCR